VGMPSRTHKAQFSSLPSTLFFKALRTMDREKQNYFRLPRQRVLVSSAMSLLLLSSYSHLGIYQTPIVSWFSHRERRQKFSSCRPKIASCICRHRYSGRPQSLQYPKKDRLSFVYILEVFRDGLSFHLPCSPSELSWLIK